MILAWIFLEIFSFKIISPSYITTSEVTIRKKHISFSCFRRISSKKIILGSFLEVFSRENKYNFLLNILGAYQFLAMFYKTTVNWTNISDFWSSFKTKTFNGTLCLCHLRGHQSFPPQIMYFTFLQHILPIWSSCKVPLWNSQMEETIYRKFLQNQSHWEMSPYSIFKRKHLWKVLKYLEI